MGVLMGARESAAASSGTLLFFTRPLLLPVSLVVVFLLLSILVVLLLKKKKRLEVDLEEASKTTEELKRTEAIYHVLENNIHEVIFTLDMNFRFTYISPSVQRQRGFTVEEAMALDMSRHVTPSSAHRIADMVLRGLDKIKKGEKPQTPLIMSIEAYCKDGSTRPCELIADFLYEKDGRPNGMIGVSRYIDDREKVKSELRLFKQAVEGTSEAIGLITLSGNHFYHNRAFSELFGYESPEILEKEGGLMLLFQNRKLFQEIFDVLRYGKPWSGEVSMAHRNGGEIPVFLKCDVIRDGDGSVLALMSSIVDISVIKKREEIIRRQESLYRLLGDNITEIVSIIDLKDQSHIYVSPSIKKIRGFTVEEAMSQTLSQAITPESYKLAAGVIAEELERDYRPGVVSDRYRTIEVEQLCKDGSTIWTEVVASFLRDENGRPVSILTAARNITERKEAEAAIRKSEERYRMLAENISEAIYTIDLKTRRHTYSSPSVQRMYGFTPEEFNARPVEEVMTPDSVERILSILATELKRDGRPGVDPDRPVTLELELYRKDGSTLWVETNVKALRDETGAPVSALGVARDISERKKAEASMRMAKEAAEAASRAKSEFLANMSHEIRTPLNGVIGMTELLLGTSLSEEQMDYAESVRSSAESLLVIINDLLDFSKIEAGKLELENIDFNLGEVFKQIDDLLASRIERKQIVYGTDIHENAPRQLKGDPARLRQILINLCENAVKFTGTGGKVMVSVTALRQSEEDAELMFKIKDTGIGISLEHQQKIFDSFFQVDASNTRKYGGTGLGLAITRKLVALMRGEMGVESKPDMGSTFWVKIPFVKRDRYFKQDAGLKILFPDSLKNMRGLKILLADDNVISRQTLVQMLEKMGHAITVADNGADAVGLFTGEKFDLVLMDIQMPVMDGIEATRKIRTIQQDQGRKVPVVAVTARAMTGDREYFISQGLDDYISKPLTMKDLAETISRNIL